jgi:hypothetical protein
MNDENKSQVTTSDDWAGGFSDDGDNRLLQGSRLPCVDGG